MSLQDVASQFLSTIENSVTSNRSALVNLSPTEISHRASFIDALESCAKLFNNIAAPFLSAVPGGAAVTSVVEKVVEPILENIESVVSSDNTDSQD